MTIRKLFLVVIVLIAGIGIATGGMLMYYQLTGWWEIREYSISGTSIHGPVSLILDDSDRPHILYQTNNTEAPSTCCKLVHGHIDDDGELIEQFVDEVEIQRGISDCSIALDAENRIHVAYFQAGYLVHSYLTNGSSPRDFLEVFGTSLRGPCIEIGEMGRPWIVYGSSGGLGFAHLEEAGWATGLVPAGGYARDIALDIDQNGVPRIAIPRGRVFQFGSWDGKSWALETIDLSAVLREGVRPGEGDWPVLLSSLEIDDNGLPHIAILLDFYALGGPSGAEWLPTGDTSIVYATKKDAQWFVERVGGVRVAKTIDSIGLAINSDGVPHIAYLSDYRDGDPSSEFNHAYRYRGTWKAEEIAAGRFTEMAMRGITSEMAMRSDGRPVVLSYESEPLITLATRKTPLPSFLTYLVP